MIAAAIGALYALIWPKAPTWQIVIVGALLGLGVSTLLLAALTP